jgi:hypothetical protein
MTSDAVEGGVALGVAIDAEAHVDFIRGDDSIHRLDWSVTVLALDSGVDMRVMREADEIGQRVHAIPVDFERRLRVVGPWTSDRLDSTFGDSVAVASDASRDRWHARLLGPRRVSMAVLAWDLVDPGVDSMTERDRLNDVRARRPWPLGENDHSPPEDEQEQGKRKHYAIHAHDGSSRLRLPGAVHRSVRQPVRNAEQPKVSAKALPRK